MLEPLYTAAEMRAAEESFPGYPESVPELMERAGTAVAREAMKRGTGARGLRAVLEEVMLEMMYELPSIPGLKECIITREVILNKERPILISEQKEQSA